MDIQTVDDVLLTNFPAGIPDLGNIDIDKFQQKKSPSPRICTPSPVSNVSSPQKTNSPNTLTNYIQQPPQPQIRHLQQQQPPSQHHQQHHQARPSQIHNSQQIPNPNMHRKIQLGPNFDRLGILNQANEIPQMAAPFFAKALQQHGGTTLGAILQAHQHAIQQQMQRENYLMQHIGQHPIFQAMPTAASYNNVYQQQQQQQQQQQHRMNHPIMLNRRSDDQIVPNPQILHSPDHWLQQPHHQQQQSQQHQQQPAHPQQQAQFKPVQIKQEDEESLSDTASVSSYNGKSSKQHSEKYFIFNGDNQRNMSEEEKYEEEQKLIMPPKNSIFVRYQPEPNRRLPSFSEAFSGYIDKLKMKEQHLKNMFGGNQQLHIGQYYRQMYIPQQMPHIIPQLSHQIVQPIPQPMTTVHAHQSLQQQQVQQTAGVNTPLHAVAEKERLQETAIINDDTKKTSIVDKNDITADEKNYSDIDNDTKTVEENMDTAENETECDTEKDNEKDKIDEDDDEEEIKEFVSRIDTNIISNEENMKESSDSATASTSFDHLDFLNAPNAKNSDEMFPCYENTKKADSQKLKEKSNDDSALVSAIASSIDTPIEILTEAEKSETVEATDSITMFDDELSLSSSHTYDNLFNGNSDEHYFQAFRDNNLPLLTSLQEKSDANEEIAKLLHSPLDFLNEKFLN